MKNTFSRISKDLKIFFEAILSENPDYIVPVHKKGSKLVRFFGFPDSLVCEKIRYKEFFENEAINIVGKKIVIIDDATKFTSTLYKYRMFFESYGAIVNTYSFVGQKKIKSGEREQYDTQAQIFKYLDESTYQEYITQQSIVLSKNEHFYDIDHFVVSVTISKQRYEELLSSLSIFGEIEFVNDYYTPSEVEKISIINTGYKEAEELFDYSVSQGSMQKIRLAYNNITETLVITPLSFPVWDSNQKCNIDTFFNKIPFVLPYKLNASLSKKAIYFNIVYVFQLFLLKHFFIQFTPFSELKEFKILPRDIIAFAGNTRADQIVQSAKEFLLSTELVEGKINPIAHSSISIPRKGSEPFLTVKSMMDELRTRYQSIVNAKKTILNVKYYLSYEEIRERYMGSESLLKWFDILSDRGVLVSRNYCDQGVFYRAYRSGEANYDQIEQKSYTLIPIAINACGDRYETEKGTFCRISSTYLNKVLANLIFDFPSENYGFHALHAIPCYYGPLTYIEDRINGNKSIPLYNVAQVSKYCTYDDTERVFVSFNTSYPELKNKIKEQFGQQDAVPYSEITSYLGFLKYIKIHAKTDNFLNALAICRDETTYLRYVHFNLSSALHFIHLSRNDFIEEQKDRVLRDAAKNIQSAKTKLKYDQNDILKTIKEMQPDLVYEQAQQLIVNSFVAYSDSFIKEVFPLMVNVSKLEYIVVNMLLFVSSNSSEYWQKAINCIDDIVDDGIKSNIKVLNNQFAFRSTWISNEYKSFVNQVNAIADSIISEIEDIMKKIPCANDSSYSENKKRQNKTYAINHINRFIANTSIQTIVILHYNFSGYKNIDDQKNRSIIDEIQRYLRTKYINNNIDGAIIFGANGSEEFGLLVFDSVQKAIQFAEELVEFTHSFSHIVFRFGCSCIKLNSDNINGCIEQALYDAQKCAHFIAGRHAFVLGLESARILDADTMNQFVEINQNNTYFEYKGMISMRDSIIKCTSPVDNTVRIGIVTVLPEEFTAMKSMIENPQTYAFHGIGTGHQFVIGDINAYGGGKHRVALARTIGDGNNKAANRAAKLIEHFPNLKVIFMVGIAGGTPLIPDQTALLESEVHEKHVRLGDIVIGNSIIQYDYIRKKFNEISYKGNNIPPAAIVVEAEQNLQNDYESSGKAPWNNYIIEGLKNLKNDYKRPSPTTDILHDYEGNVIEHPIDAGRDPNLPVVFEGKIASANTVLKDPRKRDQLKKEHNVFAVEMETSGIADVSWECGIGYYAVRGICDYCDSAKNNLWHKYASLAAAAYTKALIEKIIKDYE